MNDDKRLTDGGAGANSSLSSTSTWEEQRAAVLAAKALFPAMFGLHAFPGDVFRISGASSYVSGCNVMLYTEIRRADGTWASFAKGTVRELRGEVVDMWGRL